MAACTYHHTALPAAWAQAARRLCSGGVHEFIMVTTCGVEWSATPASLRALDAIADRHGYERPSSVSEMILPSVMAQNGLDASAAVEKGIVMLGRARARGARFSGWQHTYFERFVGKWQDGAGVRRSFRSNKLLEIIDKLLLWNRNAESALYVHTSLDGEGFRTRGGPCLQYVQIRAHGDKLIDVIGLYRAHDFGNKALGNLIGLNRLGNFIATHTGRQLREVGVVSLHPFTDRKASLLDFANDVAP